MCIGKFCNRNVVSASRDMTVLEAAHLMRHNHVGDVVVVDDSEGVKRPIGIVTDRDIVVGVVSPGLDPAAIELGDLQFRPLVSARDRAGYAETVHSMVEHGVRRMPVIDDAGLLVGIVTLDDLLRQLALPLAELSSISLRERAQEFAVRR
jgi:CBS domain-containing protein